MRILNYIVYETDNGVSAEKFLKERGFSASNITELKNKKGSAAVNGRHIRLTEKLRNGDRLNVYLDSETYVIKSPSVRKIYEDRDVLVVSKPAHLPVHRAKGHINDALDSLVVSAASDFGLESSLRIINRLDRDTTGLVVLAKHSFAAYQLKMSLKKLYYGIIDGHLEAAGRIELPICENKEESKRFVGNNGKRAVTDYRTAASGKMRSLLEYRLLTGRTHQIRVHMSALGHPLCGDRLYGGDTSCIARQALHCGEVSFTQPVTGEHIRIKDSFPEDFESLLQLL